MPTRCSQSILRQPIVAPWCCQYSGEFGNRLKKLNPALWEGATVQLSSGEMLFGQGVSRLPKECDTGSCTSPALTILINNATKLQV